MRRGLAWLLVVLLTTGCATSGGGVSIYGRQVTAVSAGAVEKSRVPREGELIAAEPARLWLLGKEQVFEIPLSSIEEVRVRRHGFTAGKAYLWTVLGAVVTGGALAGACSTVEGTSGCGSVFALVAGIWLGVGGLASAAMSRSSSTRIPRPKAEALSPYARFPQGLPEGFDPRSLRPSPSPTP
jgi:hypothetical protein